MNTKKQKSKKINQQNNKTKSNDPKLYREMAAQNISNGKVAEAIANYDTLIELKPDSAVDYNGRGFSYLLNENYDKALEDFKTSVKYDAGNKNTYFHLGECHLRLKNYEQAIKNFTKSIELGRKDSRVFMMLGLCNQSLKNYEEAISNFTSALIYEPKDADVYYYRGESYKGLNKYKEAIADFHKAIDLKIDDKDIYFDFGDCYYEICDYEQAYKNYEAALDLDQFFEINEELAKKFEQIAAFYEQNENYEKAIDVLENIHDRNYVYFNGRDLQWNIRRIEKVTAKIEERNKIIADLSHSIKNLISTIIDPLENLKQAQTMKPQVVENALRGANLIREIVNGMNLSFEGAVDDFYYDAKNNKGKDSIDFGTIIFESLKYSISNMFDGKYFSNFVRKYFPTKSSYLQAKTEWTKISEKNISNDFVSFLQNHFFKISLNLNNADSFVFGNEKGSALKMLILFQEIILNGIKYSAFVNKPNRHLKLNFKHDSKYISVTVQNVFNKKIRTKTTGIGHVIIENFANLLDTKPLIKKDNSIYSVEIKFNNFWEANDR